MNNERYARMIFYKSALDDAYKRINPLSIYQNEYEKTLQNAKIAGFKVLRNSKGEHKLIDIAENNAAADIRSMFADILRGK